MFSRTTGEIADMAGGRCEGPEEVKITGVSSLEAAGQGDLSFVQKEEPPAEAGRTGASAVVAARRPEGFEGVTIVCEDPEEGFRRVLMDYREATRFVPTGVSERADISPSASVGEGAAVGSFAVVEQEAVIGQGAVIYPFVYVGPGVRIGQHTVIHPHVTLQEGTEIGDDCTVLPNAVIGNDGFGYIQREGRHLHMPQVGGVRIGDNVTIGALTTVVRAMLERTVIEDGVKIDDHSHLAHNVKVGQNTLMVAYAKLAGSVTVGKNVLVAADVGINDHVEVGDGAVLAGGSGVHNHVPEGAVMWGYPARPINEQRRIFALLGRLPDMHKKVRALEKEVEELRGRLQEQ